MVIKSTVYIRILIFLEIELNLSKILLALSATFLITSQATACESVMGGCTKEATHDTSAQMKSQITNKIEKQQPVAQSAATGSNTKTASAKKSKGSGSLVQVVSK